MGGWHHQLDGHEFEQAPGVGDGQGGLACCGPWGRKSRTRLSHWTANTLLGVTIGSCFGASRADACWTPRSTLRMAGTSLGGGFQPGHDSYGQGGRNRLPFPGINYGGAGHSTAGNQQGNMIAKIVSPIVSMVVVTLIGLAVRYYNQRRNSLRTNEPRTI
nr:PREDICTED: glycoprotein Xg [Bos mutus]